MRSNECPDAGRKVYIMTSAWHIGDLSVLPEEQITVFVGPAEAVIDDLARCAPGGEWVLDWLKAEGDKVCAGEPIAQLRSMNGAGTIPLSSPVDGVLAEIRARRGVVPARSVVAVVAAVSSPPTPVGEERPMSSLTTVETFRPLNPPHERADWW